MTATIEPGTAGRTTTMIDRVEPRVGVYPGTFDPVTNGHMDLIERATRVVHRLVIAVAANPGKAPMFSLEERVAILREQVRLMNRGDGRFVEVRPFSSLLMHFCNDVGATLILRGLRAVSDFEYEFQMATINARLNADVETVFLTASENHQFIASSFVKEIARLGGDIRSLVPPEVARRTYEKLTAERAADMSSTG
jgi:pantetheine-phosphate adenylyltransferase